MSTAVVLSGGGFFGAFQAGAYEALRGFDLVVGASAGSLNAWAIASGMPPRILQGMWSEAAHAVRTRTRIPRYWGDGILDTTHLESMVRAMVREWKPRTEIGVVVSQGSRFAPVLVKNGAIDADVLLASCAVPFLLPAKRVGGVLSFDGGVREACPVWAAEAMGAGNTVAIDVWTHLPCWWPRRRGTEHGGAVQRIEPPAALGPVRSSALASPAQVEAWIELGRQAAGAFFARQ